MIPIHGQSGRNGGLYGIRGKTVWDGKAHEACVRQADGNIRRTASGDTNTENTRVPVQVQNGGNLGVYWLFISPKQAVTK